MKHLNLFAICVGMLLAATQGNAQVSNNNEDGVYKVSDQLSRPTRFVSGQVIVKFKDATPVTVRRISSHSVSASRSSVNTVLQKFGVEKMEKLFPTAVHKAKSALSTMKAPNGSIITESNQDQVFLIQKEGLHQDSTLLLAETLSKLEDVEYAEPNYLVYINGTVAEESVSTESGSTICSDPSGTPLFDQQYGLIYEGLPVLWRKPVIKSKRPVIAIIDTGVDIDHPDLKDNIWTNTIEAEGEAGYDNDNNGFKSDVHGWDFVNHSPDIHDYNSHGTHVAGIAAAAKNGIGIIGANPKALIMPVTVMQSDGVGDIATIVKGIKYATDNGATVLNMSFGTYANSHVLRQALENAYHSCVLVAAAGNDGFPIYKDCAKPGQPYGPSFPAAYSFVLGVQATDATGRLTGWSNFDCDGPNYSAETSIVDPEGFNYEYFAPGAGIISTVLGGKYKNMNGTSMAAPLVAGGISVLQMVKEYDSQEILWGDLLHSATLLEAYNITERPAEIDFLGMQMRDRKELADGEIDDNSYATNDGEVDAGETLKIYPILRTTFGEARNVQLKLEMGDEYEDASLVDIQTSSADFGMNLSAYGKGVSVNPLVMKISDKCADARHIKMKVVATVDGTSFEQPFTLTISNMHKIGGLILKDSTLTADKTCYVTENVGIPEGITLTIEPGTRLEFATGMGISSFGKLVAKGTPEKPIIFTRHTGEGIWAGVKSHESDGAIGKRNYSLGSIYRDSAYTQFTIFRTEATPYTMGYNYSRNFCYNSIVQQNPRKDFYLSKYMDVERKIADLRRDTTLATNPEFITTEVLQMLADWNAWNDTCEAKFSTWITDVSKSFRNEIYFHTGIAWTIYSNPRDTLYYCKLSYCNLEGYKPYMYDCEISYTHNYYNYGFHIFDGERCNFVNNGLTSRSNEWDDINNQHAFNYVNNYLFWDDTYGQYAEQELPNYSQLTHSNWINSVGQTQLEGKYKGHTYWIRNNSSKPSIDHAEKPSYLGTAREDLVRPYCYEIENAPNTFGKIDLSNMPKEPIHEAHGIVWKVVVDGKDAQDEYEDLAPLGVGKHEFCVWFNRPMNVKVAPQISFGVRDPYSQVNVSEDGSWSADSTKYTAYITITGKTASDGINQIFVRGAEDNEYFECPYEKTRFRVQVQAAGSMATGFEAEPALGRVNLTWNNENNDFTDAMGFNIYRYMMVNDSTSSDTVRLNQEILGTDMTSYTDYAVVPGTTYYYYYKVLSTDLKEYDVSNVVSCTPQTSVLGDANGSSDVDIADVITTVNYAAGENPKPFIFEAADMNTDQLIDILDVIGIIQKIINPAADVAASALATATYTVENGIVYVDCPVALAGVQVQLATGEKKKITIADDLKGFETVSSWLTDNDYIFLAYNMNGLTLPAGKHAILNIGDAEITGLRLSDALGHNIAASRVLTEIERVTPGKTNSNGVFNINGQKVATDKNSLKALPRGVYIINGKKVVK